MTPFDTPIDRRPTASMKWDKYREQDILPLWVADMDFAAPPAVLEALHARIDHGVLGYTNPPASLVDSTVAYLQHHYDWTIQPEWLVWLPGLVQGLNLACRAVGDAGDAGDAVLTATPIYPPFLRAPSLSLRELQTVKLVDRGEEWGWDFDALEAAITPKTRLLLLCHPHNPVGRAWRADELARLADIVQRHQLVVCSDEIHCDLLLDEGLRHTPFAKAAADWQAKTITLMAPSKTYNLPGLACSFAVIPDAALRARFYREMAGLVPAVNLLGFTAAEAAFRDTSDWHAGLIRYLRDNRELLRSAFAKATRLKLTVPEATYLAWIDARALDAENPLPQFEALGVGLSDGRDFGFPGYVRLNFGCTRATLQEALRRLAPLLD